MRLLAAGVAVGALLFLVEVGFAYALQAFLRTLGLFAGQPPWGPSFLRGGLAPVLVFILAISIIRSALNWSQIYMFGATFEAFRQTVWKRLLDWSFSADSVGSGHLLALFGERTHNAGVVVRAAQAATVHLFASALLGGSLFLVAPRPTLAAMVALVILAYPIQRIDRLLNGSAAGLATEFTEGNQRLVSSLRNLLLLQIHGMRERERRRVQSSLERYHQHSLHFHAVAGLKFALPQTVGISVLCVIAIVLRKTSFLDPALLVSYFYLFMRFVQNLTELARTTPTFAMYGQQFLELERWCSEHPAPSPSPGASPAREEPLDGPVGWQVQRVTFGYPGSKEATLREFTLQIRGGESVVITGTSGAGKSTLLNLLLGTLTPQEGTIEVSLGSAAASPLALCRPRLLSSIGYVGPESFLIEGSMLENLTYGLTEAPLAAEVERALTLSECGFVHELKAGLEHRLTDQGQGLSAGQKQRLALARALLRRPSALILDEATANLDVETEGRMVETLARLKGEMTIVAVTHRSALLQIADRVVKLG